MRPCSSLTQNAFKPRESSLAAIRRDKRQNLDCCRRNLWILKTSIRPKIECVFSFFEVKLNRFV